VVVSDANVAALYAERLVARLARAGLEPLLLVFPAGEASKTRETKARLEDRLARARFGGDGWIIALGGGVTGDLAGFLAATWHRGVPLVQAPTSLIAMVDAAIGGKVGVDHPAAKNLVGAFHAPLAVAADTATLATLPEREYRSALAEVVKCGAIASRALFRQIERDRSAILRRGASAVDRLVARAAGVKARIVSRDERESGERRLLNFGHTLGHAIESASGWRVRHGEAVAMGLVLESRIAVRLGILAEDDAARIERLLGMLGLPGEVPARLDPRRLMDAIRLDKKARGGRVHLVLPEAIGRHAGGDAHWLAVPESLLREMLGIRVR
jgi:3-dehydroquinate synthase